jgi:hypothetical protein
MGGAVLGLMGKADGSELEGSTRSRDAVGEHHTWRDGVEACESAPDWDPMPIRDCRRIGGAR